MLHPHGGTDRRHDHLRQRPVGGADVGRREQAGGAEAVQGRPVRYGAYHGNLRAATEITKGCVSAMCGARPSATARICCGLTASTTTSAPCTALTLSAAVLTP